MTIAEIRAYNKDVQTYQSKASELLASKDYRQKELDKLCKELTDMVGKQVTPENLEVVYTEMMSQFQQTLNTGREIIERAKAEEQSLDVTSQVSSTAQTQGTPVNGMGPGFGQSMMPGFGQMSGGLPGVPSMGGFGNYDSHGSVSQL